MNWKANIEPFKGILLGLFFITVGASINFDLVEKTKKIFPNLTVMVRAPSRMDAYELLDMGIKMFIGNRGYLREVGR